MTEGEEIHKLDEAETYIRELKEENHKLKKRVERLLAPETMLTADGFVEAIIGISYRFGLNPVVAYDYEKCIDILKERDGMDHKQAIEFMEFNVLSAYVGERTPCFIDQSWRPGDNGY